MSTVAKRYASAVIDAAYEDASEQGLRDLVDGLQRFYKVYSDSKELHELVNNPALSDQRSVGLQDIAQKLALPTIVSGLIRVLVENERMDALDAVHREVRDLAYLKLGKKRAVVKSAIALTDAQQKRIQTALEKKFQSPIELEVDVDPSIQAGLICSVGDVQIDLSVQRQMENITRRLLEV